MDILKYVKTPLEAQDEFQDYQNLLNEMAANEGDTLDNYFSNLDKEQRSSFMGLRQVRKVELFNGKVLPRQYLKI